MLYSYEPGAVQERVRVRVPVLLQVRVQVRVREMTEPSIDSYRVRYGTDMMVVPIIYMYIIFIIRILTVLLLIIYVEVLESRYS